FLWLSTPSLAADEGLIERARQEGKVVFYTSKATANAEGVAKGFTDKYGIPVQLFSAGGTQIAQKLALELRSGKLEADVAEAADPRTLTVLDRQGGLEPVAPENGESLPAEFKQPKDGWTGSSIGLMHLSVNAKELSPEGEPKSWADLADPKWKGKLVSGSPN